MVQRVLLVDDDPQFRKLLVPALKSRGLSVVEAGKARRAMHLLESEDPHLLIVDGLLPDTKGIDWIASLRRSGHSVPIVFVSAFWRDQASYKRLTQELGVALVAYKPVEVESLSAQVAALLRDVSEVDVTPTAIGASGERAVEPRVTESGVTEPDVTEPDVTEPDVTEPDVTEPEVAESGVVEAGVAKAGAEKHKQVDDEAEWRANLDKLRDTYAATLPGQVQKLAESVVRALAGKGEPAAFNAIRSAVHRLRGTAGSYGFDEISDVAGEIEDSLPPAFAPVHEDGFWDVALAMGIDDGSREAVRIVRGLTGVASRVLLVTDDAPFAGHLRDAAAQYLVDVIVAATLEEAREKVDSADVGLVVLPFGSPDRFTDAVGAILEQRPIPIAAISVDDSLTHRREALSTGVSLFVNQPVDHRKLALAIHKLREMGHPVRSDVVLVSEDPALCRTLTPALERAGMHVITTDDVGHLFGVHRAEAPDAVVIDAHVGGLESHEVCSALRASPGWHEQAVVTLTRTDDARRRLEGLEAGADCTLGRAASSHALVEAVALCVGRARRRQARIDRDRLTQLRKGSVALRALSARLSQARRHQTMLTIAVLDVDGLAGINRQHGYHAGNHVLSALGDLLAGRFRSEDLRGRLGSDEFLVAFYGESASTMGPVLSRVQEEFASLPMPGGSGSFHASFSAGLSTYPSAGASATALVARAWGRLRMGRTAGHHVTWDEAGMGEGVVEVLE